MEPVVLFEDAGARSGVSQEGIAQLVPAMRDCPGERASGGWMLLAARIYAGGAARARSVVFPDYQVRRRIAGRYQAARRRLAGARAHHAAELDRAVGRDR